ncbi:pyridoxamine 5'-phosphate oxidase [Allocatelliglobosispora scoriae]
MRMDYATAALSETDLAADWHTQFAGWFADAVAAQVLEPNAMVVATASPEGVPSARTVLMKGFDQRGFTFFTNYESRKGTELAANPVASLVFPWYALQRQVIVCGTVERVSRAETEAYFAVRPHASQIGAWASPQSRVVAGREELTAAFDEAGDRFPAQVDPPPHWGGFLVRPTSVEFWQGRRSRMHDRLRFRLAGGLAGDAAGDTDHNGSPEWIVERLAP